MTGEEQIWKTLYKVFANPYAAAGVMGNLYAESGLNPENLQGSYEKKLGMTDSEYTKAVDNGSYKNFVTDSAGYGLAQWTYSTRKKALLAFVRRAGVSVGNLSAQLGFLLSELDALPSLMDSLKTAKTVREASDWFMLKFEKPTDTSEKARLKRAAYGQNYYDRFAGGEIKMAANYDKYINSTSIHYISNSGHDENGKYTGGKAGDQTGSEWELKKWYSRPWTVVLRHPDAAVRRMIAEFGIDAALNNMIGYDQNQRVSYWQALTESGYKPANIKMACEADCTAGVTANVKAVGYLLGITELKNLSTGTYSGNMKANFTKAGFKALTAKKYLSGSTYLLPGDILLYENHHAATNITKGKNAEETSTETKKTETQQPPMATGYILVRANYYIRTEPDKNSQAVGYASKDARVIYLGKAENGWNYVFHNGITGWISQKAGSIVDVSVKELKVKTGTWYIRSAPKSSAKELGTVKGGQTVKACDDGSNSWYFIEYNNANGYISARAIVKE